MHIPGYPLIIKGKNKKYWISLDSEYLYITNTEIEAFISLVMVYEIFNISIPSNLENILNEFLK